MGKSEFLKYLLVCAVGAYAAGCGGDDTSGGAGTGGGAGTSGGSTSESGSGASGSGGGTVVDDPPNPDCPQNDIGPHDGKYAPKGACCYRTSNTSRIEKAAKTRVYEYRLNEFLLLNHKKTIDPAGLLGGAQKDRADNEEQSLLFRFEMPQTDGKLADGDGKLTLGNGRYNCDGTYSFYSAKAAPAMGGSGKVDRWEAPTLNAKVTASKTDKDRVKVVFKDSIASKNKENYIPYLGAGPAFALDWEGESMGFDIVEWPSADANTNCIGSRKDSSTWKAGAKTQSFARLDLNGTDVIDTLGVTFCQLMSFGTAGSMLKCTDTARCEPGSDKCPWLRLPDSLCPTTDADKAKWVCHLGAKNADNPDPTCSKDAPSAILDPDNGATTDGQCCDPLGKMTDGLPACNAFYTLNEAVAASAEISDAPTDKMQESCHGK